VRGTLGKSFFAGTTNPLLHMELLPCNNSPFPLMP
jgi:hypothetical protein